MSVRAVRAAECFVGSVWLAGAGSLLLETPAELHAAVQDAWSAVPVTVSAVLVGVAAATQTWLGLSLLWGSSRRSRLGSILLLLVFTAYLLQKGSQAGWGAPCACLSALWSQSVGLGIVRNCGLLGILACIARVRRRAQFRNRRSGEPSRGSARFAVH